MTAPLHLVLELTRARGAPVLQRYPLAAQEYLLRHADGTVDTAVFPWDEGLRQTLLSLGDGRGDPQALQGIGNTLQRFFVSLGWRRYELQIQNALRERRAVHLTIRCKEEEIAALPLDALTLEPEGLAFGRTPGCHLSLEWPGTSSALPEQLPNGARVFFAWSTAGGGVPAADHLAVLRGRGGPREAVDEVPSASLEGISRSLAGARDAGQAVGVLHVLCHGGRLSGEPEAYGLWLGSSRDPEEAALVDPVTLEACLAPHAGLLRCVLLLACDGGNTGGADNALGSVAQRLHRIGVPVVVASRFPLSAAGSTAFVTGFYDALFRGRTLLDALAAGRHRLMEDSRSVDWLALQVWARGTDDLNCQPLGFAPAAPPPPEPTFGRRALFGSWVGVAVALACTTVMVGSDSGPGALVLSEGDPPREVADAGRALSAPDGGSAVVRRKPIACGQGADAAPDLSWKMAAYRDELKALENRCPGSACGPSDQQCLWLVHFRLGALALQAGDDLASGLENAEQAANLARGMDGRGPKVGRRLDVVEALLLAGRISLKAGRARAAQEYREDAENDLEATRSDAMRYEPNRFVDLQNRLERFRP